MKLNYNIYENYSGGKPEEEKLLAEQMILVQVRKEYEQPERIVIRPKAKVWKDILLLLAVLAILLSIFFMVERKSNNVLILKTAGMFQQRTAVQPMA
ncbi:MAG: hypothetical protein K6G20_06875 [Ruminococcus sp.]|nr:hypothetical protein [Ruminococcus sp.]